MLGLLLGGWLAKKAFEGRHKDDNNNKDSDSDSDMEEETSEEKGEEETSSSEIVNSGNKVHRLCKKCAEVKSLLDDEIEDDFLGTANEILQHRGCDLCQLIRGILVDRTKNPRITTALGDGTRDKVRTLIGTLRVIFDDFGEDSVLVSLAKKPKDPKTSDREPQPVCIAEVSFSKELQSAHIYPLSLTTALTVRRQNAAQIHGGANIDVKQIKGWIDECEKTHGPQCTESHMSNIRTHGELNPHFIHVWEMRIVDGSFNWKYLTLSYVWGGIEMLKATKALMPSLKQFHSLSARLDQIPQVIKDAIALTKALGMKYLWVDSLCIAQDDALEKHRMLQAMDIVHMKSFLTIVALSGEDSTYPLYGLDPGTRTPFKHIGWANGTYLVASPPPLYCAMNESIYETRGWTFQERLLSRRCLYITRYQVYFNCVNWYWDENQTSEKFNRPARVMKNNLLSRLRFYDIPAGLAPSPDVIYEIYKELVEGYTSRALSYPSDVLNAFYGIGAVLEQLCGDGKVRSSSFGLLSSM